MLLLKALFKFQIELKVGCLVGSRLESFWARLLDDLIDGRNLLLTILVNFTESHEVSPLA